jgi:hypothetical protein
VTVFALVVLVGRLPKVFLALEAAVKTNGGVPVVNG